MNANMFWTAVGKWASIWSPIFYSIKKQVIKLDDHLLRGVASTTRRANTKMAPHPCPGV